MLLTIDIGNTNLVFGCFDKGELLFQFRLRTDTERTVDEYSALFLTLSRQNYGAELTIDQCIVSSVVPSLTGVINGMVKKLIGLDAILVGPGIKTGVGLKVPNPASVGADRVVNMVAAKRLFGCPCLVIDFGTATTFEYINKDGDYEGGVICPGPHVSMASLVRRTAQLPVVDLVWPKQVLGKTTVDQMQIGGVLGYSCLVDGLIEQISKEVGPIEYIVATGGLGRIFTEHSKNITTYEPSLTLHGLRLIAEMN